MMNDPKIIIGVMAARDGNLKRNPLPPTVKAVHVSALMRIRKSPKVEAKPKIEKESTPFEIIRKTPVKPSRIPPSFLNVMGSPRYKRAAIAMQMGMMAISHPV